MENEYSKIIFYQPYSIENVDERVYIENNFKFNISQLEKWEFIEKENNEKTLTEYLLPYKYERDTINRIINKMRKEIENRIKKININYSGCRFEEKQKL